MRDLKAQTSSTQLVKDLMTPREKLNVYVKEHEMKLDDVDKMYLYN